MNASQKTGCVVIQEGVCKCYKEPLCKGGLEGYDLGDHYRFQLVRGRKGPHYRVYPGAIGSGWEGDTYYETCGGGLFREHFLEVEPGDDTTSQ
jgi:hypothetical protein